MLGVLLFLPLALLDVLRAPATSELRDLFFAFSGPFWPVIVPLIAGSAVHAMHSTDSSRGAALPIGLVASAAVYLILPRDWMPEFRFATPFLVLTALTLALAGERLAALLNVVTADAQRPLLYRRGVAIVALIGFAGWALHFHDRTAHFLARPTVPFSVIEAVNGQSANAVADRLGIGGDIAPASHSILLPDIGGALWSSDLRIYDLAGLIDPTIARTLWYDRPALHRYIFNEIRPTFILTHSVWTEASGLRVGLGSLCKLYVPVSEVIAPEELDALGFGPEFYVRRDVLAHDQKLHADSCPSI
jgi:hypothetical protein